MKKLFIVGLGLFAGLVGCTSPGTPVTLTGEYYYVQDSDRTYGVRVDVKATGEKIDEVILYTEEETGWIRSSADNDAGTWKKDTAESAYPEYLKKFIGLTFDEVSALTVFVTGGGQPLKVEAGQDLGELALTGATQSAGRIVLAVQNAIRGERHLLGDYHYANSYNPTGAPYGVKIGVDVRDNKITALNLYTDDLTGYVRTSASNGTTWDRDVAEAKYSAYLDKFIGKTVTEVNAIAVTTNEGGQPTAVAGDAFALAGATQSAGRIVLAIQNALEVLA